MELIDLSQEIYAGMPVYKDLPQVQMQVHTTHEKWEGKKGALTKTPAVLEITLGEHTGTHVDALNHMARIHAEKSIDTMPLSQFYTEGLCLDFRHKGLSELIQIDDLKSALKKTGLTIKSGDTVLLCTGHYRKHYNTQNWPHGPGLTADATRWLGNLGIAAFGVETMSPGIPGISNKDVHKICGELGFTHYENLINLEMLIDKGRFRFIGLPLKIKGGTGSPVRAVAVLT